MPEIQGLPQGAVVKPIQGLPPGAVVKPIESAAPPPPQDAPKPGLISQGIDAVAGVARGFAKGVGQTVLTAPSKMLGDGTMDANDAHLAGIDTDTPEFKQSQEAAAAQGTPAERAENATTTHGAAEGAGAMLENIAEFMMGDAALKGLSLPMKMKAVQPALAILEKFPILQKAIVTGLRQGAVGAGQALAHGDSLPDALTEGAVVGVTGGTIEGGAAGVKNVIGKVAPKTTEIAGETMPKLASQEAGASKAARNAANIGSEPGIAKAQQAGSKQGVKNIAQKAAQDAIDRVNKTRVPATVETQIASRAASETAAAEGADTIKEGIATQNAKRQIGSTAATVPERLMPTNPIAAQVGTQAATIPERVLGPRASVEPRTVSVESTRGPKFETASAGQVSTFGDAAEAVRDAARPVYEQLNELSGGHFNELKNGMKQARQAMFKATSKEDYAAAKVSYDKAEKALNDLFEQHSGQIGKADLSAAKKAWSQSIVLDKVHDAIEGAFNRVPENVSARTGVPREISGGRLRTRLGSLIEKEGQGSVEKVIGQDGVDNLYRIADLLDKPDTSASTRTVLENVAKYMGKKTVATAAGAAIAHLVGVSPTVGAAAGAGLHEASAAILHKAATNPRVAKLIATAVERGVKPEFYTPLIASALRQANAPDDTELVPSH